MSTFNASINIGTIGTSLLSFDFYGCTDDVEEITDQNDPRLTDCTFLSGCGTNPLPGYENVSKNDPRISSNSIILTDLTYDPIGSQVKWIQMRVNNIADGTANMECQKPICKNIKITGIPSYTPTPLPATVTPLPATNTPTPTPTVSCSFDATVVYGVLATATPLPATNTPLPATNTPLPGATNTPVPATNTPVPATNTPLPPTNTPLPATPTPSCVTYVTFDVDVAGLVRHTDCCGITHYIEYGIGPQSINDCIEFGSVFGTGGVISNVVYNNTVCSCPATPTPLPATVTPLPPTSTPFQTTFSGYVSLVDGPTACAGGEYDTVNITVQGTSLCVLTKVLGLSSTTYGNVYGDMTNNTTFWVSDGTDEREFMRDGSAQTGTAQTACTLCSGAPPTAPPPTSTPIPATYDVYERCDLTAHYYIDYSSGNLSSVTINGECCSRVIQNVDSDYIATNYSSAIYFATYTNQTCACD